MNLNPKNPFRRYHSKRGIALLIVLAFITILSMVVISFFSQVQTHYISGNLRENQKKTTLISSSAQDYVIDQFLKEIINPQSSITPDSMTQVYLPASATNAIPIREISPSIPINDPHYYNLIRQSTPNADPNASEEDTSQRSNNGRMIPTERWNTPQLLGGNGFDSGNQLPCWIYLDLDKGPVSHPDHKAVIKGRFAYNVYEVGRLLDVNAAGYPSDLSTANVKKLKNSLAGADLTRIPGFSKSGIDSLIRFRNPQANSQNYNQIVTTLQQFGYMKPVVYSTNSSGVKEYKNNFFTSRQDLLRYVKNENSQLKEALPYLTTFSREINSPTVAPSPTRPKIVSNIGTSPYLDYKGGNSGYQKDDLINPLFPGIKTKSNFTRNDLSKAYSGETMIKKRFALENLVWITAKGPSASLSTTDPLIAALEQTGVQTAVIQRGTAENIRNYFGLTWDSQSHYWHYAPGAPRSSISNISTPGEILTLDKITDREPNFIELLKATIHAGSLGKSTGCNNGYFPGYSGGSAVINNPNPITPQDYLHPKDTSIDYQIIQIAANIIDQSDADSWPTRIQFDAGSGKLPRFFSGIEDLPYLYRIKNLAVKLRMGQPLGSFPLPIGKNIIDNPEGEYPVNAAGGNPTDPGCIAALIIPEIWNPHDQNATSVPPSLRPGAAQLRVVADNTDPISAQAGIIGPNNCAALSANGASATGGTRSGLSPGFSLNPNTSALVFGDNNGSLFREPTALRNPSIPAGSGLRTESSIPISALADPSVVSLNTPGWSLQDYRLNIAFPGSPNFIGIYLGYAPVLRKFSATQVANGYSSGGTLTEWANTLCSLHSATFRMQCKDPFGSWIDYDCKYWVPTTNIVYAQIGGQYDTIARLLGTSYSYVFDPRSSRFQMNGERGNVVANYPYVDPTGATVLYNTWSTLQANVLGTARYFFNMHIGQAIGFRYSSTAGFTGVQSQTTKPYFRIGLLSQNNPNLLSGPATYYADADGIVRRAMGAYASPGDTVGASNSDIGLPLTTATANWSQANPTPTTQSRSRPMILNRPFQNVAELGYVFRDVPWKNLDFFTPESGDSALLDLFTIHESFRPDSLIAGKINLNSPYPEIFEAILNGAYRDVTEDYSTKQYSSLSSLTPSESKQIAEALVKWSSTTPFINVGDLVGRSTSPNSYEGFSKEVGKYLNASFQESAIIQRFREAAIRPLADVGMTSTWNIMIDLFTQSGQFPQSSSTKSAKDFTVEGENHLWIHLAINRFTGEIVDKQIEEVY